MPVYAKRIYDASEPSDGYRILVDRLWPRGMKKTEAPIDEWLREVAPSTALRTWFDHDPSRWSGFLSRYYTELRKAPAVVQPLIDRAKKGPVTLLYAAREERLNHAVALKAFLEDAILARSSARRRSRLSHGSAVRPKARRRAGSRRD